MIEIVYAGLVGIVAAYNLAACVLSFVPQHRTGPAALIRVTRIFCVPAAVGMVAEIVRGSYERGDRAITVARLIELAGFYEVPPGSLLPGWQAEPTPVERREQVRRLITAAGRLLDERPAEGLALLEQVPAQREYVGGAA